MPTVVFGDNTGDDYSGTTDTQLREVDPTINYANNSFEITKWAANQHTHAVLRFDLSGVSGPVTVSSASLFLFQDVGYSASYGVTMRRLLRNWVENQAQWNIYSTGNSWTTAGGLSAGNDRESTGVESAAIGATEDIYYELAGLASDVQGFINGDNTNYGWHLERTDAGNNGVAKIFISSEGTDTNRPYLSVTYTVGGPTPPFVSVTVSG